MARGQDFITLARTANTAIWDALNDLVALQREWNALDYGNTLEPGAGANAGLTDVEVGAVLAAGHATNMAKLL